MRSLPQACDHQLRADGRSRRSNRTPGAAPRWRRGTRPCRGPRPRGRAAEHRKMAGSGVAYGTRATTGGTRPGGPGSAAGDVAVDHAAVVGLQRGGPQADRASTRSRNPGANRSIWSSMAPVRSPRQPRGTWPYAHRCAGPPARGRVDDRGLGHDGKSGSGGRPELTAANAADLVERRAGGPSPPGGRSVGLPGDGVRRGRSPP